LGARWIDPSPSSVKKINGSPRSVAISFDQENVSRKNVEISCKLQHRGINNGFQSVVSHLAKFWCCGAFGEENKWKRRVISDQEGSFRKVIRSILSSRATRLDSRTTCQQKKITKETYM